MEIPDNWLDEICKGCELLSECEKTDELCNCSTVLYDMVRVLELHIENENIEITAHIK